MMVINVSLWNIDENSYVNNSKLAGNITVNVKISDGMLETLKKTRYYATCKCVLRYDHTQGKSGKPFVAAA